MDGLHSDRAVSGPASQQDFHKLSQTIESNIQKISQNVSSMQKMVNQLNSSQDSNDIRNQFQQIQNYTEQLARDTSSLLKRIMTMTLQGSDQRQQKLTRERLGEEFFSALHIFQATQRTAAQKTNEEVRRHKPQQAQRNNRQTDPFNLGNAASELIELESASGKRREQLQMPTEQELKNYEEQEQHVLELERNITSVNDIFKELGSIIHDQSSVIDSIEANIESSSGHVETGVEQLRQTSNYQTKLRKKKLYLIVIVVIILVILTIVIFEH